MRKLKVYGVNYDGRTYRIVAATSQKSAAALIGVNIRRMQAYGSETRNAEAVAIAMQEPGTVFSQSYGSGEQAYVKVEARK